MGADGHTVTDCALGPFPEQQLSSHNLTTVTRHDKPVKLWI